MRLTTVILMACLMQVSASGLAQKITLNHRQVPLTMVLKEIRKQSGYDVYSDGKNFPRNQKVTVVVDNATVEEALDEAFKGLNLTYKIEGTTIAVRQKDNPSLLKRIMDRFRAIDVRGKVVDENNQPMIGATIKIKGTGKFIRTNQNGEFYFENLDDGVTLIVSYVGYHNIEIAAASMLSIKMLPATSELAEVTVNKGYYSETQELATGNAVTITAKDIEKQPVTNPLLAIQGRVPGLQITQNTGVTNGSFNILIRGRTSLNDVVGNNPLYVIDGVPYQSLLLFDPLGNNGGNGAYASSPQGNPLNYVNPNDIASITVLKDADATAIYGSRGGNGVILITTKKGRPGEMALGININQGFIQTPKPLQLMNTQQYLEMRREAFKNDGVPVPSLAESPADPNYDVNGEWSQTNNTDWQKTLLGNLATYTNLNLSLSGGSELVQYAVRGTYNRQGNLYPGDFNDKRGGLNFNITASSKNKKFKLDFSGNLLKDNNQNAQGDVTAYTLRAPNAPDSFNPDGTLNYGSSPNYTNSNNPFAYVLRTYSNKTDNTTISLKPTYKIMEGLVATANIGYTDLSSNIKIKQPFASYSPLYISVASSSIYPLVVTLNSQRTWIVEPQLSYFLKLNELKFNVLAGTSFQKSNNEGHSFLARDFVSDAVIGDLANAGSVYVASSGASTTQYNYNAIYGRFNVNLKDRYIVNLTGRRDGSSKFGPGKQFGNFYSTAGAWIFSKERLIEKALPFLSFGKIRASYGTSGNDNIANYAYYDLYRSRGANTYQGMAGFAPTSLANPNVAWEKNAKLEFALDLGFFKDRIFATAAYYRNRSSNQLINYTIPAFTGFSSIPNYNFPALVQNSGLELTLNTQNVTSKNLQWTSSFNISFNRNKLLRFDNLQNTSYSQFFEIGQPIVGRSVAWIYKGIDPQTGLYTALKKDGTVGSDAGNYIYTNGAYQTTVVNTAPKYFGGFTNTFRYKNLQLDVLLQFVKQKGRLNLTDVPPGFFSTSFYDQLLTTPSNVPTEFLDRWQKPGDQAKYQRYTQSSEGIQAFGTWNQSDATYVDASFIRGKNVTLSYQLPAAVSDRLKIKNASISLSGQNIFTITSYKGRDPETQRYSILPPQKVFVLGLQVNL